MHRGSSHLPDIGLIFEKPRLYKRCWLGTLLNSFVFLTELGLTGWFGYLTWHLHENLKFGFTRTSLMSICVFESLFSLLTSFVLGRAIMKAEAVHEEHLHKQLRAYGILKTIITIIGLYQAAEVSTLTFFSFAGQLVTAFFEIVLALAFAKRRSFWRHFAPFYALQ